MQLDGFGRKLRAAREQRGISRHEFARSVGVSDVTAWKWEKRDLPMRSNETVNHIAVALGVNRDFLIEAPAENSDKSITSILENARNQIASATGIAPSNVKIKVELGLPMIDPRRRPGNRRR